MDNPFPRSNNGSISRANERSSYSSEIAPFPQSLPGSAVPQVLASGNMWGNSLFLYGSNGTRIPLVSASGSTGYHPYPQENYRYTASPPISAAIPDPIFVTTTTTPNSVQRKTAASKRGGGGRNKSRHPQRDDLIARYSGEGNSARIGAGYTYDAQMWQTFGAFTCIRCTAGWVLCVCVLFIVLIILWIFGVTWICVFDSGFCEIKS